MFISSSSAFGLSLDVMCFLFIGVITFTFLLLEQGTYIHKYVFRLILFLNEFFFF